MTDAPRFKIKSCDIRIEDIRLRIPFKFGIATLTATPLLTMRVVAEDWAGRYAAGYSADVLPALWFDKDPAKDAARKVEDQIEMAERARAECLAMGAHNATVFDLWWAVYRRLKEYAAPRGINPLTAGFGASFAERAFIDAACRLMNLSFFDALASNAFGVRPGDVHPELTLFDIRSALPARPLDRTFCRHTVGLGDALRQADLKPEDAVDDGLPQSLEADIAAYGLRYFKVKIDADRDRNLVRLAEMARIFEERIPGEYHVTLDGNEQVVNLGDVRWLLEGLEKTPEGRRFVSSILFVEQPLRREIALSPDMGPAVREFSALRPLVIDESDDDPTSLIRAREMGYAGISVKNCKGVFKAVLNKCLLTHWAKTGPRRPGESIPSILSSEDLTNTGVIPLQEDLATLSALGITHSERNGHHYFRGLSHLSPAEAEGALRSHPDLYERKGELITMAIRDGVIRTGSIQAPGFGYSCAVDFDRRPSADEWRKGNAPK